ncbi:MAG: hypothetical protein JSS72_08470 [Armatimonadetes bacterium]|nr:hypothetical protein [Armatimonadota bacterium]
MVEPSLGRAFAELRVKPWLWILWSLPFFALQTYFVSVVIPAWLPQLNSYSAASLEGNPFDTSGFFQIVLSLIFYGGCLGGLTYLPLVEAARRRGVKVGVIDATLMLLFGFCASALVVVGALCCLLPAALAFAWTVCAPLSPFLPTGVASGLSRRYAPILGSAQLLGVLGFAVFGVGVLITLPIFAICLADLLDTRPPQFKL